jgi:NodT family efflux transporter outer membrane factor (OMF) lipoprotein
MRRFAMLAAVATMSACAGPRPDPPAAASVVPPQAWRTRADQGAEIPARWWRSFGDEQLAAVVEQALVHNTDVAIAAARVEEARAQFRLAEAQRAPSLSAIFGGARQRDVSPFGIAQTQTAGQAQLAISYDLDLFGRLAETSEAARANLLASEAARANVRLAITASAASGYIRLRALDARLALIGETLTARAEGLHIARRRAEAGYTSRLELSQAEAEYRATEQLVAPTKLAIARQENGLSVLIGESPRAIERGTELTGLAPPRVPARLPAELLRRRPDIVEAEYRIVAGDRSLDAARAAFMPNIELSDTGGYVASTLLGDPIGIFSLGGSILAPLFEGGRLRAQAGIATARRDQAAFAYRRTALIAFREVEDALAGVDRTREQEDALAAERDSVSRGLALATSRYRAGYSTYLEQLDAQRSLLAVQLALVQVRADRLAAIVQLYQALGGDWQADPIGGDQPW